MLKYNLLLQYFLLFGLLIQANAQTWESLKKEYQELMNQKQRDKAFLKAKELYAWVKINEGDTSIHLPVSLKLIGNSSLKIDTALYYYNLGLLILEKQNRSTHIQAARIHYMIGQTSKNVSFKIDEYKKAVQILESVGYSDYPFSSWPFLGLSEIYLSNNELKHAENNQLKLAEVISKVKGTDNSDYANCLNVLGVIYDYLQDYKSAELYYSQSFELRKKLFPPDSPEIAECLHNLALVNYEAGMYYLSKKYFAEALNIKNVDQEGYGSTLVNYATLMVEIGEVDTAIILYYQALEIHKKILGERNYYYAGTNDLLATAYKKKGLYDLAYKHYIEAKNIRKELLEYNPLDYGNSCNNLSLLYYEMGDFIEAKNLSLESLQIIERFLGKENASYATSLNTLAIINWKLESYTEALDEYLLVLKIRENVLGKEHPYYVAVLHNLANVYSDMRNYELAEKYYSESLAGMKNIFGETHSDYLTSLISIINLHLKTGNYAKAELLLNDNKSKIELLGSYSPVYSDMLNTASILYYYEKKFAESAKYSELLFKTKSKFVMDNFLWLTGEERNIYLNQEKDILENIKNIGCSSYLNNQSYSWLAFYSDMFLKSLLLETTIELEKVVALSDLSTQNIYKMFKNLKGQYIKNLSEGNGSITFERNKKDEIDSLEKILIQRFGTMVDMRMKFEINRDRIQSNLTDMEACVSFVEYFRDKDSVRYYVAILIKRADKYPSIIELGSEAELINFSAQVELDSLYNYIWQPLEEKLKGIKTVYYSPAGLINNIPIHALYKIKDGKREYVMDKYSVHQLTSTRYLALGLKQKAEEPIGTSIALFGGVNYNALPNEKYDSTNTLSAEAAFLYKNVMSSRGVQDSTRAGASYLPASKTEIENISSTLSQSGWDVSVSKGAQASENNIKFVSGKSSSVLHIATHGFAYPDAEERRRSEMPLMLRGEKFYRVTDNPLLRCGLLFAGANHTWMGKGDSILVKTGEDGVLTALELSQLDLTNTKLAVLSACQTGKGAIEGSEGTFGLQRALKLAGVENMIVSLWDVPDGPTMDMMTLFYSELAKTKKPVSAFEKAQKAMRDNDPDNPINWAGFVFIR